MRAPCAWCGLDIMETEASFNGKDICIYCEEGNPLTTDPDPKNCDGTCENNFCEARTLCEDAACDGECEHYYCSEREE